MPAPNDSILTSIKKALGLDESYTAFDQDIIMHINTVFSDMEQLGIGPPNGFAIEDKDAVWGDFISEDNARYNRLRTYMYLRIKLLFDSDSQRWSLSAIEAQIAELAWRLSVDRELTDWVDPNKGSIYHG